MIDCYEVALKAPKELVVFVKDYCPTCAVVHDPTYNAHEKIIAIRMRTCLDRYPIIEVSKDGKIWQLYTSFFNF